MALTFYIAGAVALVATAFVITRTNAVHALLYLIVSLLAVAVAFLALGAPFVAALEVIVYAGAIMVLFVFVVMMLAAGSPEAARRERSWLDRRTWLGPGLLAGVLLLEVAWVLAGAAGAGAGGVAVPAKEVGRSLFGPYVLAVELSGILLLAGLVGAYHLGRKEGR